MSIIPSAAGNEVQTAHSFIPELHVDDCDDTSCVRCRALTPSNLYAVDTWLDNAGVFTKQYREQVAGELVITGLRIGHRPDHVVAKFGNTIVRHTDGRHTVRPTQHPTGELTAAEWNERYPVGTPVVAYPGCRPENDPDGKRLVTRTRTKASTYGGHTPVVWVEGHGAWITLTHIDVIETPPLEQQIADIRAHAHAACPHPDGAHLDQWHEFLDIDPDLAGRDYSSSAGGAK